MSPIIITSTADGFTFLELQDQALHDDFAPTKYRDTAKRYLNEAQHRIFRTTRLAAGDQTADVNIGPTVTDYDLPARSVRIDSLRDPATGIELTPVDADALDQLPPGAVGPPSRYSQIGTQLRVYPAPQTAASLELRFRFNPENMVEDDHEPSIPADYHHLLVTYTRSRLFRLEDDPQMAAEWWNVWLTDLAELRADLQRRGRQVRQIPGSYGRSSRPAFVRPA